jgi:hypothetical protein
VHKQVFQNIVNIASKILSSENKTEYDVHRVLNASLKLKLIACKLEQAYLITHLLTPLCMLFFEKLIVTQLVKQ